MKRLAIGHDGVNGAHIIAHGAVMDRARAAGIITGHAADGRPAGRGDVNGKPEFVGRQKFVQIIKHDAGLNLDPLRVRIKLDDLVQVSADVDDERLANRLTTL